MVDRALPPLPPGFQLEPPPPAAGGNWWDAPIVEPPKSGGSWRDAPIVVPPPPPGFVLVPVDHDPFAVGSGPKFVQVDHDPFADDAAMAQQARDAASARLARPNMARPFPDSDPRQKELAAQQYAAAQKYTADTLRQASNGATFGLRDKMAAGYRALAGPESYDAALTDERARTASFRASNPIAATVADVGGGVATGSGLARMGLTTANVARDAGLAVRSLFMGAEGAAYGAAHGAGHTDTGNWRDYAANAGKGAVTGGEIGLALPGIGRAAGAAYQYASPYFRGAAPAAPGVSLPASRALETAANADQTGLRNLSTLGPNAMLLDAGPSMLGVAQGVATRPSEGRTLLVHALRQRDQETTPRLAAALDASLGPAPIPSQVRAGIDARARDIGQDYVPALAGARAVDTAPLAQRLDAAAVDLRGPARTAVTRVREFLNVPGTNQLDPAPQALFSTRQAIDGMIAGETNPQVVRHLTIARQEVDAELARRVPGIKGVDARYAETQRQGDALGRGQQVFDTGRTAIRPQELTHEMAAGAVPQGSMQGPSAAPMMMRQGARAELDRVVGTHANDLNALERTLATPNDWNSQKLGILFGQDRADAVAGALRGNRQFRDTYQAVAQNSQTAQRLAGSELLDQATLGNMPVGASLTGLALRAGQEAIKGTHRVVTGMRGETVRDELGRVMSLSGAERDRLVQALLDMSATRSARRNTIEGAISGPALANALLAGRDGR